MWKILESAAIFEDVGQAGVGQQLDEGEVVQQLDV